jgi:hypothetical protein
MRGSGGQRPGDAHTLLLATAEGDAPFAQHRVVALGEPRDVVVHLRLLRRFRASGRSSAASSAPKAMLSAMRVAEQEHVLRHDVRCGAQPGQVVVLQGDAVDEHLAGRGIVVAHRAGRPRCSCPIRCGPRWPACLRRAHGRDLAQRAEARVGVGEARPGRSEARPSARPGIRWPGRTVGRSSRNSLMRSMLADACCTRDTTQPTEAKGQVSMFT